MKKRLIKKLKPFSINGVHPLRYINPFSWKRLNLEKLYNTIYIFNKLAKTDFKPIPYSKRLTEIEKTINKGIVESILYELRILFGSYTIIIILYTFWLFTTNLEINLFHSVFLGIMIALFIIMVKITIKILKANCKTNLDGQKDLVNQFQDCEINEMEHLINTEEPTTDIESENKAIHKKQFKQKIKDFFNLRFKCKKH